MHSLTDPTPVPKCPYSFKKNDTLLVVVIKDVQCFPSNAKWKA